MIASSAPQNVSLLAQPGTVAFLVVFGMGVALFFLFRSMSRHLRQIRAKARREEEERFKRERAARAAAAGDAGPAS